MNALQQVKARNVSMETCRLFCLDDA